MALDIQNTPQLTTEDVQRFLVEPLRPASIILAQGPQIFDTHGDPFRVPTLVDPGDPGWFAEGEEIDEEDPDFGEITLLPSNLKSIKVIHRYSNELARHAIVNVGSVVNDVLVRKVANKMDQQFLNGDGAADTNGKITPKGILNQTGIQTNGFVNGTAAALYDSSVDAVGKLIAANITDLSKCVWFFNATDYQNNLKVKDGIGHPFLVSDPTAPGNYTLQGIRCVPSNKVPAGTAALVDFNFVVVARDMAPQVKLLDQTYASTDQLAIRVVTRQDVGLLHPQAVVKLTVTAS